MMTVKGRLVLAFGILAAAAGLLTGNALLAAAGASLLLYILAGWTLDRSADLRVRRVVAVERTFEGDSVEAQVSVENPSDGTGATAWVEAFDRIPRQFALVEGENRAVLHLRAGERKDVGYVVTSPVKGLYQVGPMDANVEDVLGLWSDRRELGDAAYLTVFPRREKVKDVYSTSKYPRGFLGEHIVRQPGQGTEFFGLRNYEYGDTLRDVNWKASARTPGKVMVNQREKMSVADATLLFDAREVTAVGTEGRNPFIYQARAASTAATFILSRRDRIRFVTYGDGISVLQSDGGERQLYKVLTHLAGVEPKGTSGAGDAVAAILPTLSRKSPVLLFSTLDDDATLKDAAGTLRAIDARVTIVTPKLPQFEEAIQDDATRTLLSLERARTLADLRGLGIKVIEWDPDVSLTQALQEGKIV